MEVFFSPIEYNESPYHVSALQQSGDPVRCTIELPPASSAEYLMMPRNTYALLLDCRCSFRPRFPYKARRKRSCDLAATFLHASCGFRNSPWWRAMSTHMRLCQTRKVRSGRLPRYLIICRSMLENIRGTMHQTTAE